jgi:hypothetical protein
LNRPSLLAPSSFPYPYVRHAGFATFYLLSRFLRHRVCPPATAQDVGVTPGSVAEMPGARREGLRPDDEIHLVLGRPKLESLFWRVPIDVSSIRLCCSPAKEAKSLNCALLFIRGQARDSGSLNPPIHGAYSHASSTLKSGMTVTFLQCMLSRAWGRALLTPLG